MGIKDEVKEFLTSRRANVSPAQAGVEDFGRERRVPGLRREEVAQLAGVSLEYYIRLERGQIGGASDSVLHAIADALQLDDVERSHLFALATRAAGGRMSVPDETPSTVSASVQRMLDRLDVPAMVFTSRQDIVASNRLGRAFYAYAFEAVQPNLARFIFLDSRAREFYEDWALACSLTAAMLRYEAGRDPLDARLTELIGELASRSPTFQADWADHDVHEHRNGVKRFHHHAVGDLELTYDVFDIPGQPGLSLTTYTAKEGSASDERLDLLATWADAWGGHRPEAEGR